MSTSTIGTASLAGHDDVIGPVAWHHQLPAGQVFVDGASSRPFESLKQALDHLDQFGGTVEPLFKLREFAGGVERAPGGGTEAKALETRMTTAPRAVLELVAASASASDYDAYVKACRDRGVLPCSSDSFRLDPGTGAYSIQPVARAPVDTGMSVGAEPLP